ncbi:TNFAIP3-interacting protein 1-like [Channa argus]|uniref:TNFAIP3-interacting protein 1-like n=1 Tax=Channa argus TaxID=215402 RepID=UPI00352020BC
MGYCEKNCTVEHAEDCSLYKDKTDRPPVDRPQATEAVPRDNRQTHRLYPSLPNIDRYDACVPNHRIEQTAGEFHADAGLEETQSDVSATNGDVRTKPQILILEQQRKELLSINEKWAKEYRTMVQYYKEKVRDLKALMQQNHSHFEHGMCKETEIHHTRKLKFNTLKDKEIKWTGDGDGNASSELLRAEEEAKELRLQNRALTRREQHQREEIKRLNKALDEALQSARPLGASSETLQDLWKHQAEIYKEDFLKERKDREKLKDKYLELKKRFLKVDSELCAFKSQATWTPPPQPALKCTCINRQGCQVGQQHTQLQRRYTVNNR